VVRASPQPARPRALVAWSSGKDAAWTLHALQRAGRVEVAGLLTTLSERARRVPVHGVRETLVARQARAAGLPLRRVPLPWPCPNAQYEARMAEALAAARADGVTHVAFGDLFLEDVRRYREAQMAACGLEPLFPLWGRDTRALVHEMLAAGLRARITCIDPRALAPTFVGCELDTALLAALPPHVDPCGERGELHTFVWDGPMFRAPVPVRTGAVTEQDGFVVADLLPEDRTEDLPGEPPAAGDA